MKRLNVLAVCVGFLVSLNAYGAEKIQRSKAITKEAKAAVEKDSEEVEEAEESVDARAPKSKNKSADAPSKKFILDGGNPPSGTVLISPMIGHYSLLGIEYGLKGSVMVDRHGFIPALNNSISVEGEIFHSTWSGFFRQYESMFYAVTGRWDFHLNPKWTVYGAAGLMMEQEITVYYEDEPATSIEPALNVGGMMILSDSFRLRAEYSAFHSSFRFGAVFAL